MDKSTTIPSLAKRDLLNIEMPVPVISEQERIVASIEELFSHLDASVAELKMAKERLGVLKEAFDTETSVTVSCKKANELDSYKLRNNDIVMGRRGEMGRCAAVTEKEDGGLCGTGGILFRLKSDFDAPFYAQVLASPKADDRPGTVGVHVLRCKG